jgi:hypothetical protein
MNPNDFFNKNDATEPNSPEPRHLDSPYGNSRGMTNGNHALASIPEMTASAGVSKQESFISLDNRSKRSMRKRRELPFNPLRFFAQQLRDRANEKAAVRAEQQRI